MNNYHLEPTPCPICGGFCGDEGPSCEERAERIADELDARYHEGYMEALRGQQLVYADDLDAPLCRIVYHIEPGDDSVGMQGWSGWVLDEDQSGTAQAPRQYVATGWVRGNEFRTGGDPDTMMREGWAPVEHIPPSTPFAPPGEKV